VDRLQQYIQKILIRKRNDFILMVCKYWSLKREARRGAPLLKRLHLEPWTATNAGKTESDEEKGMKLEVRFPLFSLFVRHAYGEYSYYGGYEKTCCGCGLLQS
jgi:hypothetical protein